MIPGRGRGVRRNVASRSARGMVRLAERDGYSQRGGGGMQRGVRGGADFAHGEARACWNSGRFCSAAY